MFVYWKRKAEPGRPLTVLQNVERTQLLWGAHKVLVNKTLTWWISCGYGQSPSGGSLIKFIGQFRNTHKKVNELGIQLA